MTARMPQRYDCAGPKHPWEHCDGCYHMEPSEYGDYVHWDDYASLRAINAELLAGLAEIAWSNDTAWQQQRARELCAKAKGETP